MSLQNSAPAAVTPGASSPSRRDDALPRTASLPQKPSALYGPMLWKAACILARMAPEAGLQAMAMAAAAIYQRVSFRRRRVVVENLLPAVNGNRAEAESLATSLFAHFAVKLVDLWRFEAGRKIDHLFLELEGRHRYVEALEAKRGVLLLTPHLGNWEFGAPLLARHGYKLNVITLAEPGHGLTEMRQAARARWGIETVVIGRDPFAFVEIIRRLENGATVALLVDRPPSSSAIEVQLFGRPFSASIAAAELARATGCELLPVYLTRVESGYGARILPKIDYERAPLRDRGVRQQLTQRIMDVFAPAIRENLDQWYHFVPIWGNAKDGG